MKVKSFAKINLYLDIVGKRPDGYHLLKTVMQTVDLYDELVFEFGPGDDIQVLSNTDKLKNDRTNIIYRAIELMKQEFNISSSINVALKKNIPMGAGLGGGSSNAAAIIKTLAGFFNISCPYKKLIDIACRLGADVPFFLKGQTALCEGIGEIIIPLAPIKNLKIVIVNPNYEISTAEVFKRVGQRAGQNAHFPLTKNRENDIITDFTQYVADDLPLYNVLEDFVLPYHSGLVEIKDLLKSFGCPSLMSGSGASVFGILKDEVNISELEKALKNKRWSFWFCRSI